MILFLLFFILSYMMFLIFINSKFLKYEIKTNGYNIPGKVLRRGAIPDYYVDRRPLFVMPLTRIGYDFYNIYHRLTIKIPYFYYVERLIYHLGVLFYSHIVVKTITVIVYIALSFYLTTLLSNIVQLIFGVYAMIHMIMMISNMAEPVLKNRQKGYHNYFINYLIAFDGADHWNNQHFIRRSGYYLPIYTNKAVAVNNRQMYFNDDYDGVVKDQSSFELKYRNKYLNKSPVIEPVIISYAVNHNVKNKTRGMGGRNFYKSVDFVDIDGYSKCVSNGMMTYLDGYNLIKKGQSLRDVDEGAAGYLRRKSNVPAMNDTTRRLFDRTHLVHHRLSGCEGGYGSMVPMYKSVNTGTNSIFHGKVTGEPVRNSMKYYEDFAIQYLENNPSHQLLYSSIPTYMDSEDVVPTFVTIKIYRVADHKSHLLKEGIVRNDQYNFDKDKDHQWQVDYKTGAVSGDIGL